MDEIWKKSEFGCGNYEFSNLGRVRNTRVNKIVKGVPNSAGYLRICNTRTKTRIFIHKEVARLFFGECPKGYVVNHKDGNKLNNSIDNLEYITKSDNALHAITKFDKIVAIKKKDVINVINDYNSGMSISKIALKYKVHRVTIYKTLLRYGIKIKNSGSRDNQQPNHKYKYHL